MDISSLILKKKRKIHIAFLSHTSRLPGLLSDHVSIPSRSILPLFSPRPSRSFPSCSTNFAVLVALTSPAPPKHLEVRYPWHPSPDAWVGSFSGRPGWKMENTNRHKNPQKNPICTITTFLFISIQLRMIGTWVSDGIWLFQNAASSWRPNLRPQKLPVPNLIWTSNPNKRAALGCDLSIPFKRYALVI